MSISSSFRLFSSKIPQKLLSQPLKPNQLQTLKFPTFSSRLLTFRQIHVERLPTKPVFSSPCATLQPVEELPRKLQDIVKLFRSVQDPRAKYEQLLFYGRTLDPLDDKFKTPENRVQGCVSKVWVRAFLDSDKNVTFQADSDSSLTKGLAALLVQGLSGCPVEEIVKVSPDFVTLLGLQQSLTPSRNNGFLNMLKLMQKRALQLYMEADKGGIELPKAAGNDSNSTMTSDDIVNEKVMSGYISTKVTDDKRSNTGNRKSRITEKIEKELLPTVLEVEDISYQHAGHAGVRGSDGETHFNLKVVSREFEGKSLVKRHRLIYNLLQDELQSGLHALSIIAKTPSEVQNSGEPL